MYITFTHRTDISVKLAFVVVSYLLSMRNCQVFSMWIKVRIIKRRTLIRIENEDFTSFVAVGFQICACFSLKNYLNFDSLLKWSALCNYTRFYFKLHLLLFPVWLQSDLISSNITKHRQFLSVHSICYWFFFHKYLCFTFSIVLTLIFFLFT